MTLAPAARAVPRDMTGGDLGSDSGSGSGSGTDQGSGSGEGGGDGSSSTSGYDGTPDHTGWRVLITGGGTVFDSQGNPSEVSGLHPGDPGAPPDVMEGSLWSGQPELVDGEGDFRTDDEVANYSWTFPADAVKGYGNFGELEERPGTEDPGKYWVFNGASDPSSMQTDHEPPFEAYKFTKDDLNFTTNEVNDHVINTFYWGPGAGLASGWVNQVSVTATFVKVDDGQVVDSFTGSDSEAFNVIRPQGGESVKQFGVAGVSDGAKNKSGTSFLAFSKDSRRDVGGSAESTPVGIQWDAYVNDPKGSKGQSMGGSFIVTQTQVYVEYRSFMDGNNVYHRQVKGVLLDKNGKPLVDKNGRPVLSTEAMPLLDASPYEGRLNDPRVGPKAGPKTTDPIPVGHRNIFYLNDNPSSALGLSGYPGATGAAWSRSDSFKDTLMYNPDPVPTQGEPASIWIPVGAFSWKWSAKALLVDGKWVQAQNGQSQSYTNCRATTHFPIWPMTSSKAQSGGFFDLYRNGVLKTR